MSMAILQQFTENNLPSGIYFIRIHSDDTYVKKVIDKYHNIVYIKYQHIVYI